MNPTKLPRFFRVKQSFARPRIADVGAATIEELGKLLQNREDLKGNSVAIAVGSRGISGIAPIAGACVEFFKQQGANPFIVPAMGSHGGATADGQAAVLDRFGINARSMRCPIMSSMDVVEVCQAAEGFPVYFDRHAYQADHVLVVNRIKPHTRFIGAIESGLMKMMLIGLGKQRGAEVYHRVIMNYSFDQIVRSVAKQVLSRCKIIGGLAILENAYEETADLVALGPAEIEPREPELLQRVKDWMPKLPFDHGALLIIDRIGKDISGTGMDTNIIGRKQIDHAAAQGEKPNIHHVYVRSLTEATHGNASGIGLAELCHKRVLEKMDHVSTRMNCITAGHVTGAMLPVDFPNDREALIAGCQLAGYVAPENVSAMWIRDTLSLQEVECSEYFYPSAKENPELEILREPSALDFDEHGDFLERF